MSGFTHFLADVRQRVAAATAHGTTASEFILEIGEAYAFIRLHDLRRPWQFLQQVASQPPVAFSPEGFRASIVDDQNPARHYTAFVFVGYWLPTPLAVLVLWMWEILGFVRYRGHWSQPDIRSGYIGISHGRALHRQSFAILPDLIARDLDDRNFADRDSADPK
ncbi:MAG: hypothetical protein R3C14_14365 [Caldilineaceae bacterium]